MEKTEQERAELTNEYEDFGEEFKLKKEIDWFRWLLLLIILGLIGLAIYLRYIGDYPLK